jgi:hypothetical protein
MLRASKLYNYFRFFNQNFVCICFLPHLRYMPRPFHPCTWSDNIKMYLTETGRESTDCIHLPQGGDQWQALVNTEVNFRFHTMLRNNQLLKRDCSVESVSQSVSYLVS